MSSLPTGIRAGGGREPEGRGRRLTPPLRLLPRPRRDGPLAAQEGGQHHPRQVRQESHQRRRRQRSHGGEGRIDTQTLIERSAGYVG